MQPITQIAIEAGCLDSRGAGTGRNCAGRAEKPQPRKYPGSGVCPAAHKLHPCFKTPPRRCQGTPAAAASPVRRSFHVNSNRDAYLVIYRFEKICPTVSEIGLVALMSRLRPLSTTLIHLTPVESNRSSRPSSATCIAGS